MRCFRKGKQPDVLTKLLRETPHAQHRYGELIKGDVREECLQGLLREQGGLCAYCQGRIGVAGRPATIEHYVHQSDPQRGSSLQLSWNNWVAVCFSEGSGRHCDKSRGAEPILLRPSPELERAPGTTKWSYGVLSQYEVNDLISYNFASGKLVIDDECARTRQLTDEEAAGLQRELDDLLRLNGSDLCRARLTVLKTAKSEIDRMHGNGTPGLWQERHVREILKKYEIPGTDGNLREYNGIVVAYLTRWLKKHRPSRTG